MSTESIIGLVIALGLLGSSAWQEYKNDRLERKIINLETIMVYNKAVLDGNYTKQKVYKELTDKIEKEHDDEVKSLNDTAIGDSITFP